MVSATTAELGVVTFDFSDFFFNSSSACFAFSARSASSFLRFSSARISASFIFLSESIIELAIPVIAAKSSAEKSLLRIELSMSFSVRAVDAASPPLPDKAADDSLPFSDPSTSFEAAEALSDPSTSFEAAEALSASFLAASARTAELETPGGT